MFIGSSPKGFETVDLDSERGYNLGGFVLPVVGAEARVVGGVNNGSLPKVVMTRDR